MSLLAALREGTFGVRFELPERYVVEQDEPREALLVDPACALGVKLSFADIGLDIRPRHEELWRRDVEIDARALFERWFAILPRPAGEEPPKPRTADASWSPVIETGRVRVGAAEAVTVLLRVSYEPGHETVLGYLLVPLGGRMLECRAVQTASVTGMRESTLLSAALATAAGESPLAVMQRLGQRHYDDPAYDAEFPGHPVSLVRAALRELVEEGRVVVAAAPPAADETVELAALGLAVTAPARYVRTIDMPAGRARWTRASFSCTDGVRLVGVTRLRNVDVSASPQALAEFGERLVRRGVPPTVTDVRVTTHPLASDRGPAQAETLLEYTTDQPRMSLYRWRALPDRSVLMILGDGEIHVPIEEMRAEVAALARSVREFEPDPEPVAPRPWWKFW